MSNQPPDNVTFFPTLTSVPKPVERALSHPPPLDVDAPPDDLPFKPTVRQEILYHMAIELRMGSKRIASLPQWIAAANASAEMGGHPRITFSEFERWCKDKAFLAWFYAPLIYAPNEEDKRVLDGLFYEVLAEQMAAGTVSAMTLHAQVEGKIKRVEAEAPLDAHAQMAKYRERGDNAPPVATSPAASKWKTGTGE